ncbi:MAG: glycine zipper family protein [Nitrospirota bacterium]
MKKVLIIAILSLFIFQSAAFAIESEGELIFRDAMYGAAIGALLGTAIYLADQDQFGQKLGIGVALGTLGGLAFGVMETKTFVEIEKDKIRFAVPTPVIEKKKDGVQYSASLLRTRF